MASCQCTQRERFAQVEFTVIGDTSLTAADRVIYAAIRGHRNHRSGMAWPSRDTLASITGFHPNSISRSTRRLIAAGYLIRTTDGRGRGRSTAYSFPLKGNPAVTPDAATPIKAKDNHNGCDLTLPPDTPDSIRPSLVATVKGLPDDSQQALLDELTGAAQQKEVRNPVAYLRKLRQLHDAGDLIPVHAHRIALERRRRREAEYAYHQASHRAPMPLGPPQTPTAAIAGLRAALRGESIDHAAPSQGKRVETFPANARQRP